MPEEPGKEAVLNVHCLVLVRERNEGITDGLIENLADGEQSFAAENQ